MKKLLCALILPYILMFDIFFKQVVYKTLNCIQVVYDTVTKRLLCTQGLRTGPGKLRPARFYSAKHIHFKNIKNDIFF